LYAKQDESEKLKMYEQEKKIGEIKKGTIKVPFL